MTRRPIAFAVLLTTATLLLAAAGPALAFRQPDPTPLGDKTLRHPDLYIGNLYQQPGELTAMAAEAAARDLAALGVAPEHSRIDLRSGRWGTLLLHQPLLPGHGNDLTWDGLGVAEPTSYSERQAAAWNAFVDWILGHPGALRIDPGQLRQPGHVTVHDRGAFIQIHAPRMIGGVPVRDSYLTAVISGGNLILFGAYNWGDVAVQAVPELSAEQARERVLAHLAPFVPAVSRFAPVLEFIPLSRGGVDPAAAEFGQGLEYRLAWVDRPRFAGSVTEWEALVDARTGELIAFEDKTNYGVSTRAIIGGVYPLSNDQMFPDGLELVYPLPFADLTVGGNTLFTDGGGNLLACVDGTITSELSGPFVAMTDNCGAISESTTGDLLDLGTSGGTDCVVPSGHSAGDTHATRSAFYELNKMQEMARGQIPNNVAVNRAVPSEMNFPDICNATGGGGGLTFFRFAPGQCSNTGELAGVFDHEWGHYMDALDAAPGISSPGEGIADIYASLRLNTSCIGRNFRLTGPCNGYGDPCLTCTGVRDIDWAQRASGNPHGIPFIDAACGGGPAPCGGGVHCEGAVYSETVWDLWNRDLQTNYGMGIDQAREIATRLTFRGGQLVGVWYNCINGTGTGDGCNANGGYLNYLAADDDDANLLNGTPHMNAIFDAFDRHDIACPTPTVQDSGCAGGPTTAPTVTVTPIDRGAHLSWTAVPGAVAYRVFRTETDNLDPLIFTDGFEFGDTSIFNRHFPTCDYGKILVAETTELSYTDSGLTNERAHHYQVLALGNGDLCLGPASACTRVVPTAGPNLILTTGSTYVVQTGDGDPVVDNCEQAEVTFSITNVGNGTQTDVRALSVTSPSHPAIDASVTFPPTYAVSLGACGTVNGTFTFEGNGLAQNDTIEFLVEVTSDELDAQVAGVGKTATYTIELTENDLTAPANVLYDFEVDLDGWTVGSGTFNRTGGGGGNGTTFKLESSAFLPNQCDKISSPVMQVQPTSTLSLWNNYDIEPLTVTWYDRANVALEGPGGRTVYLPDGGRPYQIDPPPAPGAFTGCNDGEPGWAAANTLWAASTFSATAFGGETPGALGRLEVTYSTDPGDHRRGFWFDEVSLTDVSLLVPDAQSDVCGP